MNKILITGATGFVGTRLIARVLESTDWEIVALTRRRDVEPEFPRLRWLRHDLLAPLSLDALDSLVDVDLIVHAAAEVSGLSSVTDPVYSIRMNVLGAYHLLEAARRLRLKRFVYLSSGEVMGPVVGAEVPTEEAPLRPASPYAAGKAAGEELARAYHRSFGVPVMILRPTNLFGPGQGFSRFVPMVAQRLLMGESIVCHVDGQGKSGSRQWLHVDQFLETLLRVISLEVVGETYHVPGPERTNAQMINLVAGALGKTPTVVEKIAGPSHGLRYAIVDTKLNLDFNYGFEKRVFDTARFYA
jgi:dTDP-glucose 4,6-dehydratase